MARGPDGSGSRISPWSRCPAGALADLGKKNRSRRRRRAFLKGTLVAGAVAVAGSLSWWLVSPAQPPGGLTCNQVEQLVDAYAKGKLDEDTRRKVRQHVAVCPMCGPRFKAMGLET